MKIKLLMCMLVLLSAANAFAQGGKAEPNRITFAKGKSSTTVTGSIAGSQQAEYIFAASEGQTVTLKITSIPKGKFSAFKVLNAPDAPEYVSDYDSYYDYTFKAPYTGDYLVWVHFKPAGKTTSAKYNLVLSIK